jgi:hypothetical protein
MKSAWLWGDVLPLALGTIFVAALCTAITYWPP